MFNLLLYYLKIIEIKVRENLKILIPYKIYPVLFMYIGFAQIKSDFKVITILIKAEE